MRLVLSVVVLLAVLCCLSSGLPNHKRGGSSDNVDERLQRRVSELFGNGFPGVSDVLRGGRVETDSKESVVPEFGGFDARQRKEDEKIERTIERAEQLCLERCAGLSALDLGFSCAEKCSRVRNSILRKAVRLEMDDEMNPARKMQKKLREMATA
eukprot:ANDGO_03659.mRNA.1 hypothetical protein